MKGRWLLSLPFFFWFSYSFLLPGCGVYKENFLKGSKKDLEFVHGCGLFKCTNHNGIQRQALTNTNQPSWWGNVATNDEVAWRKVAKSSTFTLSSLPKRTGTRRTFVRQDALCHASSQSWKLLRQYPDIEVWAVTVWTWSRLGFNKPDWRSTLKSHCGITWHQIEINLSQSIFSICINKRNRLKILLPDESPTPNPNIDGEILLPEDFTF